MQSDRTPSQTSGQLTRLGRYELVTRLALGGMAEVYLARHGELSGFKTLVVIKKVLPHLASNPEFISMFLDEARIASRLDHPNVVRIFEVGRATDEYFLAMELVQGKPLASLIRRAMDRKEFLSPKVAAMVVAQAAAGLHHAHGLTDPDGTLMGLVHRDVSPQNILVSFEGSVKVIDFGIARALGRLTDTSTGTMKGKTGYMAPEQAKTDAIDHRTDIFALGVVLWEALCCRSLFKRPSDFATINAILYEPVPPPSSVRHIPHALEDIVMKALAREPVDRYQSAQEMAIDLERFVAQAGGMRGETIAVMRDYFGDEQTKWKETVRRALEMEEADPPLIPTIKLSQTGVPLFKPRASHSESPLVNPPPPLQKRRMPLALLLGGAALLVAALVAGVLVWRGPRMAREQPAPPPAERPPPTQPTVELLPLPVPPTPAPPPPPALERPVSSSGASRSSSSTTSGSSKPRKPERSGSRTGSPPRTTTSPPAPTRRPNPF